MSNMLIIQRQDGKAISLEITENCLHSLEIKFSSLHFCFFSIMQSSSELRYLECSEQKQLPALYINCTGIIIEERLANLRVWRWEITFIRSQVAAYLGDLFSVGHEGDSRHVHDGGYGTTLTSFTRKENIFGGMEFILRCLQNVFSYICMLLINTFIDLILIFM